MMMTLRERMRHAFHVDPAGPAEPTPEQRKPVEWVAREVVRRGLATPGLIGLEMGRPLNWITSQLFHAISPLIWAVARGQTHDDFEHFTRFLEKRGSTEHLCRLIEQYEAEREERQRASRDDDLTPQSDET